MAVLEAVAPAPQIKLMSGASQRGTISLESARILSQQSFAGAQYVLRLHSPRIAARARPGSFVHVRCAEHLPMRRPLSIMRIDAAAAGSNYSIK